MCGVLGIHLQKASLKELNLVQTVFEQSMIRGKHATGFSWVKDGKVHTVKEGIPVNEFLNIYNLKDCVNEDGGLYMVGHIRYSTSDLRFNQPFSNKYMSVVHNGVISQEDPSEWVYDTETSNDSELILKSFEHESHPLKDFHPSSMAVCTLNADKTITGFRNEARPLWYTEIGNGIIFTSTKDIAKRSGLRSSQKCEMYRIYKYSTNDKGRGILEVSNPMALEAVDLQ